MTQQRRPQHWDRNWPPIWILAGFSFYADTGELIDPDEAIQAWVNADQTRTLHGRPVQRVEAWECMHLLE
jgi:hypothetical protein